MLEPIPGLGVPSRHHILAVNHKMGRFGPDGRPVRVKEPLLQLWQNKWLEGLAQNGWQFLNSSAIMCPARSELLTAPVPRTHRRDSQTGLLKLTMTRFPRAAFVLLFISAPALPQSTAYSFDNFYTG